MNQTNHRKIAVIDVDGTLIEGQTQQGLIKFFYSKGKLTFTYLARLNFWFLLYKFGLTDNMRSVFEFGLQYLKNKPVDVTDRLIEEYVQEIVKPKIFSKSFDLINTLRSEGYSIILLSTAVDAIISKIAKVFSVDDYLCTRLEVVDGIYTGHISGKIVYGDHKIEILKQYLTTREYSLSDVRAYADHKSDLPVLRIVGKAFVANPTTHMARLAQKEGIDIMYLR